MKPPPDGPRGVQKPSIDNSGIDADRPRGSWLSILFVSILGFGTLAALGVLTLGVMPQVVILGVAMLFFVGLNYLIWGWWLGKFLPKGEEDEKS